MKKANKWLANKINGTALKKGVNDTFRSMRISSKIKIDKKDTEKII